MKLLENGNNSSEFHVPDGVNVIALIFYGRREFVQILDLYLQRNLKDNGGLLDSVVFVVKTKSRADLNYLDQLLEQRPCYSKFVPSEDSHGVGFRPKSETSGLDKLKLDWWSSDFGKFNGWVSSWGAVSEPESVYIKIDDDVVFIEDSTIPALTKRILENPHYFGVSANVINGGAISWVHYRLGVYKPYWPELNPPTALPVQYVDGRSSTSWRDSDLPSYVGPLKGPPGFNVDGSSPAPFEGHRWLPVRLAPGQTQKAVDFPASKLTFDELGPASTNWAAGAQTHYSFLHHLEQGDTWRYKFDVWDFNYERLAINFFAIRGRDVMESFPFIVDDDEEYLTRVRPRELGRPVVVDGTGLASHFAFALQRQPHDGKCIMWTDLLSRYRAYAEEVVFKAV